MPILVANVEDSSNRPSTNPSKYVAFPYPLPSGNQTWGAPGAQESTVNRLMIFPANETSEGDRMKPIAKLSSLTTRGYTNWDIMPYHWNPLLLNPMKQDLNSLGYIEQCLELQQILLTPSLEFMKSHDNGINLIKILLESY